MSGQGGGQSEAVERVLRGVFDRMFEGIQLLDQDWTYVYLNETAADHGRRSRDELLGRSMLEAYPGIEQTEMFGLLERCRATGEPQQMVNRFVYPDGTEAWFELRIYEVSLGTLILSADITDRKTADDMLHQSQKMEAIGRLAGGVAHDFNNLLSVITGYTDILLRKVPEGSEYRSELEQILKASENAASLTRQLLAFSRKRMLQPEVLDLNDVVARTGKMLRRLIGEDIELVTRLPDDLDPVRFDPGQIDQILMNLAINARDAMPDGGTLTIETANVELDEEYAKAHADATAGPHVMIAVTDTGVGMDRETRVRIFEPFFTTKELGHGTGLGLATIYGIVKQSGGNIWVYSEPDVGTTFKVYLPRAGSDAGAPPPRRPAPAPPAEGSGTVLVVEDDPAVRDVIRRILEMGGYEVLATGDPEAAVEIARSHGERIHVLLTDVVLPGMNGRELADAILKERDDGPAVVFMSGYTDDAVTSRGVLESGSPFIEKPFTAHGLLERIRGVLS